MTAASLFLRKLLGKVDVCPVEQQCTTPACGRRAVWHLNPHQYCDRHRPTCSFCDEPARTKWLGYWWCIRDARNYGLPINPASMDKIDWKAELDRMVQFAKVIREYDNV